MTRCSAAARRILLGLASLAVGLGLAEALVHLVGADPDPRIHYAVRSGICCDVDPQAVWRIRPHIDVTWRNDEYVEHTRTNALGMRGPEPAAERAQARILAVGDSFTFGVGVNDDESYPAVLAQMLHERGVEAEVLNAGVPGYGFDQAQRAALSWSAALRPDLVLVGVHCTDLSGDWDVPLWDLHDGRLVPVDPRRNWIALQFRLQRSAPRLLRRLRLWRTLVAALWHADPFRQLPRRDEDGLRAWQRDKIVAALSGPERVAPRVGAILMPCKEDLDGSAAALWSDLGSRLEAVGVPTLVPGTEIRGDSGGQRGRSLFFERDIHLDVAGNRWLAARVESFVLERGLLPARAPARPDPVADGSSGQLVGPP